MIIGVAVVEQLDRILDDIVTSLRNKGMTNYIEELKERRNRVHNHGTCECCDNWTKIRDIELAEVDRRARADWLRSEIEKLEVMKETRHTDECLFHVIENCTCVAFHYNKALTSIITRYKEELKVLTGE